MPGASNGGSAGPRSARTGPQREVAAQVYPREPTVRPGGRLVLHVSTAESHYRVAFFRVGLQTVHLGTSPPCHGYDLSPGLPDQDWGWPPEEFDIPDSWPGGVYLAVITAAAVIDSPDAAPAIDARSGRTLFVVRRQAGDGPRILYKLSWATYHAYNASGGGSMYHTASFVPTATATVLTTRRPGGGTGGQLSFPEAIDVYDESTPREGFAHWDLPMLRWLEREGVAVDFCTDLDLHRDPDLLSGYRLLLSVGHDEYWSPRMRQAVQQFVAAGGNVAFFSGNTSWWRIDLADNGDMTCVHPPVSHPKGGQWWRSAPENAMTGVSYRRGGGWWDGPRDPVGYTVQHGGHWVYEGLGLRTGDTFGAEERLVGYECDGATLDRGPDGQLRAAGTDGTPLDLAVLGVAQLGEGWQDRPAGAEANAVLGAYSAIGTVFTCGTTDWPRVLEQGNSVVAGVTRNVLRRLVNRGVRVLGPFPARHGRCLAVAGHPVTFHVALDRPVRDGTRFWWTISAGDRPAEPVEGGLSCATTVPDEPGSLTVTVLVEDEEERLFGWTSVPVLSRRQAAQVDVLCGLRDLVIAAVPALSPTAEVGVGNRPFGDPRWDPVRDGLRKPMGADTLRKVLVRADQLARIAAPFVQETEEKAP
ncbi:N,N-dimethylformamidase beta subunit family domain-containing protein [Mycobacterium gastri]|uniref:N,N-dimethylformamidase beta subunit family domain-containing protein n=1 Tax=Mycobacterium gastri TaxID=1777 RepID=UPI001ABFA417|nr:N,N-dimethylformamidase beta subunit family domain-containing protein [Mycobacterium gastri]